MILCSWRLNTLWCGVLREPFDPADIPSRQCLSADIAVHSVTFLSSQLALNLYYKPCAFENVNINFRCIKTFNTPEIITFLLPMETNAKSLNLQIQGKLRALTASDFCPSLELLYEIYLPFVEETFVLSWVVSFSASSIT